MARYEELRRQAFAHHTPGRGELGHALFVHKGMVAWMDAWGRCLPDHERERPASQAGGAGAAQLVRNDVVMVLAAMALSHLQEMIR